MLGVILFILFIWFIMVFVFGQDAWNTMLVLLGLLVGIPLVIVVIGVIVVLYDKQEPVRERTATQDLRLYNDSMGPQLKWKT